MSGQRSEILLFEDIVSAAERLVALGAQAAPYPLGCDQTLGEGILFNIIIMGEAAKRLSSEIYERFDDIPWRQLARTRDRIIHHYEGVDWEVIQRIIDLDLPVLIPRIRQVRDIVSDEAACG